MHFNIFLDAVDRCPTYNGAIDMTWLPKTLPKNLKVIMTVGNFNDIEHYFCDNDFSDSQVISIEPMAYPESKELLKQFLRKRRRQVTEQQWDTVKAFLHTECTPVYIRLLLDEVCLWRSYEPNVALSHGITHGIMRLFDRLEERHGEKLVAAIMKLLMLSRHGLAEGELIDMLRLDDEVGMCLNTSKL